RAAPRVTARLRILEALARPAADAGGDDRRPVRLKAIAIGCADESAAVRTRAVQLADAIGLQNVEFWSAATADRSALVRAFGAVGAARQHGPAAAPLLLDALATEQDEHAFVALHKALAKAHGVDAPTCDAASQEGRAAAVAGWRRR
ncbi:MAG: hypothetical protein KAI24_17900, partial [Planctomycetes bacterium]|nr:hypothetical protein [Planctomycetota bacterium]